MSVCLYVCIYVQERSLFFLSTAFHPLTPLLAILFILCIISIPLSCSHVLSGSQILKTLSTICLDVMHIALLIYTLDTNENMIKDS